MKYIHLLRNIAFDERRIKQEGRFKRVRETLAGANLAIAVQAQMREPTYVQLSLSDPPDFFLCRGTSESEYFPKITYVEHTSFGTHPSQRDLAGQLATTKLRIAQSYEYDYILCIEMEQITSNDINVVKGLVREKGIEYKVWLMEGKMQDDDEAVHVVTLNTPFEEIVASCKDETERYPDAPAAFRILRAGNTTKILHEGQPAPWPDPLM